MLPLGLVLSGCLVLANAYIWPSPQLDALESLRFDLDKQAIANFIEPCTFNVFASDGFSGRSDAADWIRTAYHDMAPHNIADGTGGLDASIRFDEEQARPENPGDGFGNTVSVLRSAMNRYVSLADSIAMGLIFAVESCGGPTIAFRGGRLDAGEPNSPGVPEPQQDLNAHISAFARQGFTQTEMISLIACGHTFGGVEHSAFPNTVPEPNDPNNTLSVAHFDSTFVTFDNNVAKEYLSGTTQNPLVVGLNDTTNSDKRIFGSDGNATMRSFADSAELFSSTCATLFARMLDTVPRGVQLTQVITALPVKPDNIQLALDGETLQFSGHLRLWDAGEDADRTVRVLWDDHAKGTRNESLSFSHVDLNNGRTSSAWYDFNATQNPFISLDAVAGITNMRFAINDKLEDQGGVGFAVQDSVVFSKSSCKFPSTDPFNLTGRFDIAVRNGVNPTRMYLEAEKFDDVLRTIIVETDIPPPTQPVAANAAYSLWSIVSSDAFGQYTIGAEIDGVKISLNNVLGLFSLSVCPES